MAQVGAVAQRQAQDFGKQFVNPRRRTFHSRMTLALPTYSHTRGSEDAGVTTDEFEFEFAKRITSDFALSLGNGGSREHGGADGNASGFGSVSVGWIRPFAVTAFAGLAFPARVGTTFSRAITQPLGSGTYKVRWRVLSKDGHWTRGDYYFSVKVAPN